MKADEIVKVLAPCGLNCLKCMAYAKGDIRRHACELQRRLGAFDAYAARFAQFDTAFEDYPAFKKMLERFEQASCRGCRAGDCLYPNCHVARCSRDKGIDFCFQCDEFPCEKTNFDPHLRQRWIAMNTSMKEKGLEAYVAETKDLPRYV